MNAPERVAPGAGAADAAELDGDVVHEAEVDVVAAEAGGDADADQLRGGLRGPGGAARARRRADGEPPLTGAPDRAARRARRAGPAAGCVVITASLPTPGRRAAPTRGDIPSYGSCFRNWMVSRTAARWPGRPGAHPSHVFVYEVWGTRMHSTPHHRALLNDRFGSIEIGMMDDSFSKISFSAAWCCVRRAGSGSVDACCTSSAWCGSWNPAGLISRFSERPRVNAELDSVRWAIGPLPSMRPT